MISFSVSAPTPYFRQRHGPRHSCVCGSPPCLPAHFWHSFVLVQLAHSRQLLDIPGTEQRGRNILQNSSGWRKSRNTSGHMLCCTSCDSSVQCSVLLGTGTPQRSLCTASGSAGVHDAPYVPMNICKQPLGFFCSPY